MFKSIEKHRNATTNSSKSQLNTRRYLHRNNSKCRKIWSEQNLKTYHQYQWQCVGQGLESSGLLFMDLTMSVWPNYSSDPKHQSITKQLMMSWYIQKKQSISYNLFHLFAAYFYIHCCTDPLCQSECRKVWLCWQRAT